MNRRTFLGFSTGGIGLLAGCQGRPGSATETPSTTELSTGTSSGPSTSDPEADFDIEVTIPERTITAGESLSVVVSVTNPGDADGSIPLQLALDDDLVATESVDVSAGEELTHRLTVSETVRIDTVEVSVNGNPVGEVRITRPDTWYVGPEGDDDDLGIERAPLASIQAAFEKAQPGETIHALPGRYHERVETVRPGKPGAPITLTGPPEAVFVGGDESPLGEPLKILHSHVHILGLTFDGLQDPQRPDDVSKDGPNGAAYAKGNISVNTFDFLTRMDEPDETGLKFPGYIQDIKIKPHAVGNVLGAMINTFFANDVEIGEFRVIGPGGLKHLKGDASGHNGEIVYVGTPYPKFRTDKEPDRVIEGADLDESHNYHIHHIDNSEGHPHAELVDIKGGVYDVTIEYCTDSGGGARYLMEDHAPGSESAARLEGRNCVFRWNIVENSHGNGVATWHWCIANPEECDFYDEIPKPPEKGEQNYEIYGNRLLDNGQLAVKFDQGEDHPSVGPDGFTTVCGNEYNGETHGEPDSECPEDLPTGDGLGHTGGESPWA